ncbi:unnamed protein product [marine sediment metagenome]|uniref:Uncharacterized protein n=2 Tax=marine sediment metagenome TaxID=412755 RepID=X1JXE2_9ZZZZ
MPRYPIPIAKAEEMITLPPPSKGQLNKIVKQRSTGGGISKVYICVQNSTEAYEWVQIGIST